MSAETAPEVGPENPVVEKKYIPLTEIAKHNTVESPWLAINGKIYDVKEFLDQHPGGEEVILEHAGTDATTAFDDVGHSSDAIEMLDDMYVGDGNPEELKIVERKNVMSIDDSDLEEGSSKLYIIIALLVAGAAYYYFKALKD